MHRFTIDAAAHATYGLSYPATFVFEVPPGPPTLRAYKLGPEWIAIPTRDASEVYSGVEAARFDFAAGRALVSAAFPADSDTLTIGFVDERSGTLVSATFDSMARYYDDSQAVVVLTADDWQEHDQEAFHRACDACQARELWFTPGICTAGMAGPGWGPPDWNLIQEEIDQGFVEPASHSRHHLYPPYNVPQWGLQSSYEEEIIGSKQDILDQLSMPALNRRGAVEYLYTWIEPFGVIDHAARLMVGANGYLADRQSVYSRWFASWHETYGLYPVAGTAWIDTLTTPGPMNALFDWILYEGSIYIMMCHPRIIDWQSGPVLEHLDYLARRPEVSYVGLGHLYAYHLLQDRNLFTHQALSTTGVELGIPAPSAAVELWSPVPNPCTTHAELPFVLAAASQVRLAIYDVSGRMVRQLLAGPRGGGAQAADWDVRDDRGHTVAAGVYFIRLESGGAIRVRRLTCAP